MWETWHSQPILFTTKSTKDTKGLENLYSELCALRGEYSFTLNPEELRRDSTIEMDIDFGLE